MAVRINGKDVTQREIDAINAQLLSLDAQNQQILANQEAEQTCCTACYPTLSDGITISTATPAWTLDGFTEILPSGQLANDFEIQRIHVVSSSDDTEYELHIFKGELGSEIQIGCVPIKGKSLFTSDQSIFYKSPILPAGTRLSAKIASANSSVETLKIKIVYLKYE